ncbi:MAG: RNA polymerase sigma factor [Bacteroidales bacterium]
MNENEKLLDQLQAGDQQAFRILVEKYQPMIRAIALQMFGHEEDQEDFMQEVFVRVYQALPGFRRKSMLSTWIYRIALNHALNLARRNKWKAWFGESLSKWGINDRKDEEVSRVYAQPENGTEQREMRRMLNKAIQRLPENQRIAFIMTRIDGLSYAEVAQVMNLSESAVDSLTQRARQNLRKYLANYYKEL